MPANPFPGTHNGPRVSLGSKTLSQLPLRSASVPFLAPGKEPNLSPIRKETLDSAIVAVGELKHAFRAGSKVSLLPVPFNHSS